MSNNLAWLLFQPSPTRQTFCVSNWFAWIIEARDAGYSQNDIRWILNTVGVMDDLRRVVEADNRIRQETTDERTG